ncbi:MAG: transcriptional regulator, XRE family [uncultured Caballeronia sp.]|nr:MAG: transcriptional regulator, XRE family [uncultured Caballeronia sp.]
MHTSQDEFPLEWIGSSYKDPMQLPAKVRKFVGFALNFAQHGIQHSSAKVLKGFSGAGVLEVVENNAGGTYRTVYTVRFEEAVFAALLPEEEQERHRHAEGEGRHGRYPGAAQGGRGRSKGDGDMRTPVVNGIEVTTSSGNVFADLGLPNADKLKVKSGLMIEITKAVRRLDLTQEEVGRRMGLPQPKVSALLRGDFTNLSERKLMDALNRLGYDIEITVRPTADPVGHLTLAIA